MNKKSHPYRFTAKEWDEETKLYYMSARYQNPMTSRWMSVNPSGFQLVNPMDGEGNLRSNFSLIESINWYSYVSNNPVIYLDPNGMEHLSHISLTIFRHEDSPGSRIDSGMRGMDYAILRNSKTGEFIVMTGGQTYSNHSKYPASNTIKAFSGNIIFEFLGEITEENQTLHDNKGTSYAGPVLEVNNTTTEGGGTINGEGVLIGSDDTTPFRVHSDEKLDGSTVNMASGGCPMFPKKQLDKMGEAFESWGVNPGDTINGHIEQDFPQ